MSENNGVDRPPGRATRRSNTYLAPKDRLAFWDQLRAFYPQWKQEQPAVAVAAKQLSNALGITITTSHVMGAVKDGIVEKWWPDAAKAAADAGPVLQKLGGHLTGLKHQLEASRTEFTAALNSVKEDVATSLADSRRAVVLVDRATEALQRHVARFDALERRAARVEDAVRALATELGVDVGRF